MMYIKLGKRYISLDRILRDAKPSLEVDGFARIEYADGVLELVSLDESGLLATPPSYDRLVHLRITRYTGDRVTKFRFSIPRYLI